MAPFFFLALLKYNRQLAAHIYIVQFNAFSHYSWHTCYLLLDETPSLY